MRSYSALRSSRPVFRRVICFDLLGQIAAGTLFSNSAMPLIRVLFTNLLPFLSFPFSAYFLCLPSLPLLLQAYDKFFVSHIIIPNQEGTPDACQTLNEE